jgi:hypothetical protein
MTALPPEPTASAAQGYAEQGMPIFPCRNTPYNPKTHKTPYTKNGFHDATTDPKVIAHWWHIWPDALIGMPTGPITNVAVLDLDVKNGKDGFAYVTDWESRSSTIARTGSGGAHLYYNATGAPHCTSDQIALGVDTRGEGGYVILPPSEGYTWTNGHDLTNLQPWPNDLRPPARSADTISNEPQADPTKVDAAMSVIPNKDLGWDDWNRIGMACWAGSGGKSFDAFDRWSKQSSKYDADTTSKKWSAYTRSPPTKIGAGTIFQLASEADPRWRNDCDESLVAPAEPSRCTAHTVAHPQRCRLPRYRW